MAGMKRVTVATPVGELNWVYFNGQGSLNFNEDGYQYKASVMFDNDDPRLIAFTKKVEAFWEEHKGTIGGRDAKTMGFKPELDKEKNPTGRTEIMYSTRTEFEDKKTGAMTPVEVKIYNAGKAGVKPAQIKLGNKRIGNGSMGALSGSMSLYKSGKNMGVTFYLAAIQIVKFIEFDADAGFGISDDANAYQGEDEDLGFSGDSADEAKAAASTPTEPEPTQARPEL